MCRVMLSNIMKKTSNIVYVSTVTAMLHTGKAKVLKKLSFWLLATWIENKFYGAVLAKTSTMKL
jgi:hypothetical protein